MSIAFQSMRCVSVYESPDTKAFIGDQQFPMEREREGDVDSSSSSSIGRNSDISGDSSGGEDSNEVESSYKGPLSTLDSLEVALPIKGISKFYNGKSKSFTSLADASSALSIKDLVKPENPYTRKRKNLLAHNNLLEKSHISHFKSNVSGTSKKTANPGRSTFVVGVTVKSSEINNSEDSNSMLSSHSQKLPPLHPQCRRCPGNGLPSSHSRQNTPWRSFSLSDLQCAAATSPHVTSLSSHGEDVDNKQF